MRCKKKRYVIDKKTKRQKQVPNPLHLGLKELHYRYRSDFKQSLYLCPIFYDLYLFELARWFVIVVIVEIVVIASKIQDYS